MLLYITLKKWYCLHLKLLASSIIFVFLIIKGSAAFVFCWEICVHSRCLFLSVASRLSFIELRHYIYKLEQFTSPLQLSCKGWGMFRALTLKTPCHLLILFKRKIILVPKVNIRTPNKFMTIPWWLLPCFWEILNSLNMCMYFIHHSII